MRTWAMLRDALPPDLSDAEINAVRRATAPQRARARREAAWGAAMAAVPDSDTDNELYATSLLGVEAWASAQPTCGTRRLSAFDGLGTGRRHASDGGAWTEAIRSHAQMSARTGSIVAACDSRYPDDPPFGIIAPTTSDRIQVVLGYVTGGRAIYGPEVDWAPGYTRQDVQQIAMLLLREIAEKQPEEVEALAVCARLAVGEHPEAVDDEALP